jgi:hypothetical protein
MRVVSILVILALFTACASPSRMVKNQQYDRAIEKLSKDMRTGKAKGKQISLLSQAYHTANQLDHDRIMLLRQSGQPDIWSEVYRRYLAMNNRQDKIKTLPATVQQQINFRPVNYGLDMADAKAKASAYLYARAESLLQTNERTDARRAYNLLFELSQFNRNYRDTEILMRQALMQGTNQVLLAFDNQTGLPLPEGFIDNLMQFNPADFKDDFVNFDVLPIDGKFYDYTIWISLKNIQMSPDRSESRSFTESKEVRDGTKPKRDENGNIVIDSAGKVVEVPNYRIISARVDETMLSKSALLEASLDFENNSSKSVVFSIPVSATSNFNHAFAFVNGDLNAISKETRRLVDNKPVPFPPDGIMVIEASRILNQAVKRAISKETPRLKRAE